MKLLKISIKESNGVNFFQFNFENPQSFGGLLKNQIQAPERSCLGSGFQDGLNMIQSALAFAMCPKRTHIMDMMLHGELPPIEILEISVKYGDFDGMKFKYSDSRGDVHSDCTTDWFYKPLDEETEGKDKSFAEKIFYKNRMFEGLQQLQDWFENNYESLTSCDTVQYNMFESIQKTS